MMLCHFKSCYVMSCHVKSCQVMSSHVMLDHVMLCYVILCHIMSWKNIFPTVSGTVGKEVIALIFSLKGSARVFSLEY